MIYSARKSIIGPVTHCATGPPTLLKREFAYMLRNPPGASPGWLAPGLVTESGVSPDVENPCI